MTRIWVIVGLLTGIVATSVGGGWYLHLQTREQAVDGYQVLQQHTADELAALLESDVATASRGLMAVAAALPPAHGQPWSPANLAFAARQFDAQIRCRAKPCFSAVAAFDDGGALLVGTGPPVALHPPLARSALDFVRDRTQAGSTRTLVISDAPPAVLVVMALGAERGNGVPAMLAGRIELRDLFEHQRLASAVVGRTGETLVLQPDGRLVFHSTHPEMSLNNVLEPTARCFTCHDSFDYIREMLGRRRGALRFRAMGQAQLAAFSPVNVGGDQWIVAVKAPRDGLVGPLASEMGGMLLASVLFGSAGALGVALMWRMSRERIRAEETAHHREQTASLFTAMREGVAIHRLVRDATGRPCDYILLEVNEAYEKAVGILREQAVGNRASELYGTGEAPYLDAYANVVATGESLVLETHFEPLNKTFSISVVKIGPDSFATIFEDVSERHRLEQQFRQAQKMEAVGRLAGGVAHDFNNMLTAIIGFAELALAEIPVDAPYRADIEEVKKAGETAATVTRQLLAFSRKQVVQPKAIDLNEQLVTGERFLKRLIGEDVAVVVKPAAEPAVVVADPSQIEQVLMNLAVNARDAMPNGGTLTIAVGRCDLDESEAAGCTDASAGSYVTLAVRDTGVGMSPEVRARLFEPFFTTKERGKGTGLGLATVYGIVKQSGGLIKVDSEVGRGSTFTILLPATSTAVAAEDAAEPMAASGSETILVVEDDATVRQLATIILERGGYTVLTAETGNEGLVIYERSGTRIDLVLTDIVMPGMSGTALAERLTAGASGPRVVFMSGYASDGQQRAVAAGGAFLQKPFTAETLTRKVREVLGAGGGAGAQTRS